MQHLGLGVRFSVILTALVRAALERVLFGVLETVDDGLAGVLLGLDVLLREKPIKRV